MSLRLFEFRTDRRKCAMCNFRATSHYVLEQSEEAAREEFEHFDERGLCGDCQCQQLLADEVEIEHTEGKP